MNACFARRAAPAVLACATGLLVPACGGGGGGPTSPNGNSGPTTDTFTGTVQTTATSSCNGNAYQIATGSGTITVALVQASGQVKIQVCHPSAVNHDLECTVPPFAPLTVAQSVSAPLRGGRAQVVSVFPPECATPGAVAGPPVTYTITVTYPR